jgi:hypothetical protein
MTDKKTEELEQALKANAKPKLDDQGDIAADDAGATAMAERLTRSVGVQGEADDE